MINEQLAKDKFHYLLRAKCNQTLWRSQLEAGLIADQSEMSIL